MSLFGNRSVSTIRRQMLNFQESGKYIHTKPCNWYLKQDIYWRQQWQGSSSYRIFTHFICLVTQDFVLKLKCHAKSGVWDFFFPYMHTVLCDCTYSNPTWLKCTSHVHTTIGQRLLPCNSHYNSNTKTKYGLGMPDLYCQNARHQNNCIIGVKQRQNCQRRTRITISSQRWNF